MTSCWLKLSLCKINLCEDKNQFYFYISFSFLQGAVLGFEASGSDGSSQPLALFSNPACKSTRLRMSIRLSRDGCKTWSNPWLIRRLASGYSDMTKYQNIDTDPSNPTFAILYESGGCFSARNLTFQTFTFSDVCHGIESSSSCLCCCSCCCCFCGFWGFRRVTILLLVARLLEITYFQ